MCPEFFFLHFTLFNYGENWNRKEWKMGRIHRTPLFIFQKYGKFWSILQNTYKRPVGVRQSFYCNEKFALWDMTYVMLTFKGTRLQNYAARDRFWKSNHNFPYWKKIGTTLRIIPSFINFWIIWVIWFLDIWPDPTGKNAVPILMPNQISSTMCPIF